uniref:G protein-coupled receptor n=1 Tax=Panagrolaimus davidi TaxID=227884 RepID=A0A914QGE5_9BILA
MYVFLVNVNTLLDVRQTFIVYTYVVFGMHLLSLSVITVLYYQNRKMYKITAYRISLQKRYQIAENLKILSSIFPLILIYTVFSPMGAVITLIRMYFSLPRFPVSILHIFNNFPHLIIFVRLIFNYLKKNKNVDANNDIVVKNVLGKNISTAVTTNTYFKDLKEMWS